MWEVDDLDCFDAGDASWGGMTLLDFEEDELLDFESLEAGDALAASAGAPILFFCNDLDQKIYQN